MERKGELLTEHVTKMKHHNILLSILNFILVITRMGAEHQICQPNKNAHLTMIGDWIRADKIRSDKSFYGQLEKMKLETMWIWLGPLY